MAINGFEINAQQVNGDQPIELISFPQTIIEIEQTVVNNADSQSIIEIEQEVIFRGTHVGSILEIEQSVIANAQQQPIIEFEQTVIGPGGINATCSATNWDLIITLNGAVIPNTQIVDTIRVDRGENESAIAQFTVKADPGIQDQCGIIGKSVTIDVIKNGQIQRIYTGQVNYPEYSLVTERTTIYCTDNRLERINEELSGIVKGIGYWTESIFGEPSSTAKELQDRLETVPEQLDFDNYGNYFRASLLPKSTEDFVISDSDVFRRTPKIEILTRSRVINKVNINLQYRYSRLHHSVVPYVWQHPDVENFCSFAIEGRDLATRAMIASAASGSGWQNGPIVFTDLWDPGYYNCGGGVQVGWSRYAYQGAQVSAQTDASGNPITYTDSNGNIQVQTRTTSVGVVDQNAIYCLAAFWDATKRWTQTLTETYSISVEAPQSQAQFGVVEKEEGHGVQNDIDDTLWEESYDAYTIGAGPYEPFRTNIPGGQSFYADVSSNRSQSNESILVVLNRAKTEILKSHRENKAILELELDPSLSLKNTCRVLSNRLEMIGKVSRVTHSFDVREKNAFSVVEISNSSVCAGSASDTPITIPSAPGFPQPPQLNDRGLGNHFGLDPETTPAADRWTGMVGNKIVSQSAGATTNIYKTQYPISFTVETPDIPDNMRNELTSTRSAAYSVEIPNNEFDIIYVGGCG